MNATARLFWKEWRCQQGFLAAAVILSLLVQGAIWLHTASQGRTLPIDTLFGVACWSAVLYMLGCAATLFATEHEAGTFAFQQALPTRATQVLTAKLGFALASTITLVLLITGVAALATGGRFPSLDRCVTMATAMFVTMVEMAAWSVLFSLLLKQPLRAALLAVACQSVVLHAVLPAVLSIEWSRFYGIDRYTAVPGIRLALAALLLGVDLRIGTRWLGPRPWQLPKWSARAQRQWRAGTRSKPFALSQLLWLQWRHSKAAMSLFLLAAGLVAADELAALLQGRSVTDPQFRGWQLLVPVAALCGALTFAGDQHRRSFRFLAERGVSPTGIWFSRQVVWLGFLVLLAAAAIAPDCWNALDPQLRNRMGATLGAAVVTFSIGQLCSIFLRSTFVAVGVTIVASLAAAHWIFTSVLLAAPIGLSIAPIPGILLFASWLRAKDWLLEKRTWRSRRRAALSLAIPLTIMVAVLAVFRTTEYRPPEPGFLVEEFLSPTPEGAEVMEVYRRSWEETSETPSWSIPSSLPWGLHYVPQEVPQEVPQQAPRENLPEKGASEQSPESRAWSAWAANHEDTTKKVLAQTHRSLGVWREMHEAPLPQTLAGLSRIGLLLVWSGVQRESEAELDESLKCYLGALRFANQLRERGEWSLGMVADVIEENVYRRFPVWAVHPDQTQRRLLQALAWRRDLERRRPPRSNEIKASYLIDREMLTVVASQPKSIESAYDLAYRMVGFDLALMPWEMERARRVLAYETSRRLLRFQQLQEDLDTAKPVGPWPAAGFQSDALRTTPLARTASFSIWHPSSQRELIQETKRRGMTLVYALQIWHNRHGTYPTQLSELTEGLLASVPLDPSTGMPYQWHPGGPGESRPAVSDPYNPYRSDIHVRTGRPLVSTPAPRPGTARMMSAGTQLSFPVPLPAGRGGSDVSTK